MLRNFTLRYKLFFVLAIIIFFYSILSVLFVNIYLKDVLEKHFVNSGKTLTGTVSAHIMNALLTNDFIEIYGYFENTIKHNPDVSYIFIEKNGHILLDISNEELPEGLLNIGHNKDVIDIVIVDSDNKTYYDFSSPLLDGKEGILRIGMSGTRFDEIISKSSRTMLYIALVFIMAALGFSIVISRKLTNPLSKLTNSAIKLAYGDYSKTVHIHSDDEVGKLSQAFQRMENAVIVRENELREVNEELETVNVTLHEYIGNLDRTKNELESVNIRLHEYIEELDRTKDELIKTKQDKAVVETTRAFLHHMRQPLTYLIMAIELVTDELLKNKDFDRKALLKKLLAVQEAGNRFTELLKKIEKLRDYKTVTSSDDITIIDIEE